MPPNRWNDPQLTDPRPHVLDFDLRILRGCLCGLFALVGFGYRMFHTPTESPSSFSFVLSCTQDWVGQEQKLTKVQIRLGRHHQRFRFDASHCGAEISVVGFLLRDVAGLPCVEHSEHVLGV